jgi:hypothetical protein
MNTPLTRYFFLFLLLHQVKSFCPPPQLYSHHALCSSRTDLVQCLDGHEQFANKILSVVDNTWPLQSLTVIIPADIAKVTVMYVDHVGQEVDYGTHTKNFTIQTYSSHAWRLYVGAELSIEIGPDAVLPVAKIVRQYLETKRGYQTAQGMLSYYNTTTFQVVLPCRAQKPYRSPYLQHFAVGRTGMSILNAPFSKSSSTLSKTLLQDATVQCHANLNMWTPLATHGAAILQADVSDFSHDTFTQKDMDNLIHDVVHEMTPSNRFDMHVTRRLNVHINPVTCDMLQLSSVSVEELREALVLMQLTFFDAIYVHLLGIHLSKDTRCVANIVQFLDEKVILPKLAKTWGFTYAAVHNELNTTMVHDKNSIMRAAWSHAILTDQAGPSAGVQQRWSNLGASKGTTFIDQSEWQLMYETNRVGCTCWTGSAQNLFATHSNSVALIKKNGKTPIHIGERTIDDSRVCSPATLSPPFMTVALRLTTPSTRNPYRPSSDLHCGAGGKTCELKDTSFQENVLTNSFEQSTKENQMTKNTIDWRNREAPGSRSQLGEENYALLQHRTETTWNRSVIWNRPKNESIVTEHSDNSNDSNQILSKPVPWNSEVRKKRVVVDGLLSEEECQILIQMAEKHAYSGSSYSGSHRQTSAMNKVSSASWISLLQDQSTAKRKEAAKVSLDAVSRIRAVVMAYYNLTELYISNSQVTARLPGGMGHPSHSDDCIWREDRNICEPSNKVHECCVNYHYSAILFLTNQNNDLWSGSRFFWHEKMGEPASIEEVETWPYPRRTRVNNRCGRLVAFSAGEENPHGAESIGLGPGAHGTTKFEVHAPGASMNEEEGEGEKIGEDGGAEWSAHARWALTNWFSSDRRFTRVEKDVGGFDTLKGGYTVDPWGKKFKHWLKDGEW